MPPRAASRRQARFSSREPDTPSSQNLSTFQKPNLPPLQGMPSSRRQYSYGADVEPMPSRPGHGLQRTHVRDISNAVRSALTMDEGEDSVEGPARDDPDDAPQRESHQPSYLSGPSVSETFSRPQSSSRNQILEGSDADEVRSFGMESDLYGDATIDSTPRAQPSKPSQPSPLSRVRTLRSHSVANSLRRPMRQNKSDEVALTKQPTQNGHMNPANTTVGPSPLRTAPRRPPKIASAVPEIEHEDDEESEIDEEDAKATEEFDEEEEHESEDESEEDGPAISIGSRHAHKTNTPAPRRRQAPVQHGLQKARLSGPSPALPPPQRPQRFEKSRSSFVPSSRAISGPACNLRQKRQESDNGSAEIQDSEDAETSQDSTDSGQWLAKATRATATSNFSSLFAHAKSLASSSPFAIARRYPVDQQEREAAIQREIDAAEEELAQERRQEAARDSRRCWEQRWLRFKAIVPFASRAQPGSGVTSSLHQDDGHHVPLNFLRYLNPLTYVNGVVAFAEAILDWIMRLIYFIIPAGLWDRLSSIFAFLPHIIAGLLAFFLAFTVATHLSGSTDGEWVPNAFETARRTLDDVRHGVYNFVPTISWSRQERWASFDDLWDDDDTATDKMEQFLDRMEDEFLALKRTGKMHEASLKKLENILPYIVHMELRDGMPVISQEFWHALRDLLRRDGAFLTFDKVGSELEVTSERQWKAIASRLVADPAFTLTLDFALEEFGNKIDGRMAAFWDTWVRDNDERIAQMLGSTVDEIKSAGGSRKEFEERLAKVVKEQLAQAEHLGGQVVTRDEFIRHLRNEFASHRSEIRAELRDLQPRMEELIKHSVELATKDIPYGMTRADVTTLVNGLIRKALADVNLEAMARGTIHRHWDSDLRHQINYFSVRSGAIIDAKHSSNTWDPARLGIITQDQYQSGRRGPRGFPPIAALDPWHEQGDCWCAARSFNHRGNPHGASLAVQIARRIIPQHIVIEHILPGATSEPGARPRDIEVYAEIPDSDIRERILDFGAAHFPDDENDWNFTPPDYPARFVKITQFVYESADLHDGVYVHRLSSELIGLGAATDHVIVRAVSNYGAENHTCFYRVRLYGFDPEVDAWP